MKKIKYTYCHYCGRDHNSDYTCNYGELSLKPKKAVKKKHIPAKKVAKKKVKGAAVKRVTKKVGQRYLFTDHPYMSKEINRKLVIEIKEKDKSWTGQTHFTIKVLKVIKKCDYDDVKGRLQYNWNGSDGKWKLLSAQENEKVAKAK